MISDFDGKRLSHAYIASGEQADMLAMAAICAGSGAKPCKDCADCKKFSASNHPDVTIVKHPEKKRDILIDQIRELKRDVIVVPGEAAKKVYIIEEADRMNANAQNAFLRILEEPPSHAVFILKTENPSALLETVRSRCVETRARVDKKDDDSDNAETVDMFFAAIKDGNAELVKLMFSLDKMERNDYASFLASARRKAAEKLRAAVTGAESGRLAPSVLERVERELVRAMEAFDMNVNIGHISGMLCASFITVK